MRLTTTAPGARDRVRTADGAHSDAGFTLIELLITVVILGVIALPLGNAIIGVLRHTDATTDRLALSHDAQISAAYFGRDVASVGMRDYTPTGPVFRPSIQQDAAYNSGGVACGTAATPVAKLRLLSDAWQKDGLVAVRSTDVVAYYLQPAGTVSELHRIKCVGTATPVSDVVLAHNVDPATLTVACSSACGAAAVPEQVTLTFSVTKPAADPYEIILTGQRRQT